MTIEEQIKSLVEQAAHTVSTGQLCMCVAERLQPNVQIRITAKGVRVVHSRYIDRLGSARQIDEALASNQL